jgi:hypothetical protein
MQKVGRGIAGIVMWNYERGSWQYDVMCALIVAFILFTPRSVFRAEFNRSLFVGGETQIGAPAARAGTSVARQDQKPEGSENRSGIRNEK